MNNNLEVIASALLDMSQKAGAEAAEVIGLEKKSLNVDVLNGMLEGVERSEAIDIGLRVIVERRQACLSCSDVREESLEKIKNEVLNLLEDETANLRQKKEKKKTNKKRNVKYD